MRSGYYAGIDIGTNAARLVIKNTYVNERHEIEDYDVQEIRIPLRLGVDVFKTGAIGIKKEEQLVKTMACFKNLMDIYDVIDYRAMATSAMREAKNGQDIIWRIRKETGVDVQIISGNEEANTIARIAKDFSLDEGRWVFIDVGGGSTEVSLLSKGKPTESNSFELGTLRILAGKDRPETWKGFKKKLADYRDKYGNLEIVGTGGNINRYWKMSQHKEKKGLNVLYVEDLRELYGKLKQYSVGERMEKFKLKPDRADVIIPAGDIFLTAAETMGAKFIVVPMTGLGDGIVDELVRDNMNVI